MFALRNVFFLATIASPGLIVSASWVPQWFLNTGGKQPARPSRSNVSECILLFGAFCNGNLGDIIQASTMSRLVKSLASDSMCVWHAHPANEETTNCFQDGRRRSSFFFGWGGSSVQMYMQYCCINMHFHCLSTGDIDCRPSARDKSSTCTYILFVPWQHSMKISWSYGFGYGTFVSSW